VEKFSLLVPLAFSLACADVPESEAPAAPASVEHALGAQNLDPRVPGSASIVFSADAVIDASPEEVWDVIVDLPAYEAWNPWVFRAEGDMSPGGHVEVDVKLGKLDMHAQHTVLRGSHPEVFCWRDEGWNTVFVYGQRCRFLTRLPDGRTQFHQEVLLEGPMAHLFATFYGYTLQDGVDAETPALAERVEFLRNQP
jgi:uncharacterized protein YndB with AHSA1/START domain